MNLSEANFLLLLLAWEAGEVSEGRVCQVAGLDRLTTREKREEAVAAGSRLAEWTTAEITALRAELADSALLSTAATTTDPP